MAKRIPKEYAKYHKSVAEIFEGKRPSLDLNGNLLPAKWLPVAIVDAVHDDPVSIPAGTWVGRINTTDHGDIYESVTAARRTDYMVPACASTGEYSLTYTANDVTYLTPDIDSYPTVVAAAGTSTLDIPAVKPIGIVTQDIYASHLQDTYTNYMRTYMAPFLSWGYVVMIPVRTSIEAGIEPGDLVAVDNISHAATSWAPTSAANRVGRMMPFASGGDPEYIVGRCLEKVVLATQTAALADQTLTAGIVATNVSNAHNFGGLINVQTVPGLTVQGSGSKGLPGGMLAATAQSGYWYCLLISVSCV